jgi:hypothetical protein
MRRVTEEASNDNMDVAAAIAELVLRALKAGACEGFADRERAALEIANEGVRRALEQELRALEELNGEVVEVEGARYRRHEPGCARYHSLCGSLEVTRWTYRKMGVRNGPTIVPLEMRAGIIERATPHLAYAVAQGYAKAPIRSVHRDLQAAHRAPPSRATMERMAKAIGTHAKEMLRPLEQKVRTRERPSAEAVAITLGLDRTSVPMEEVNDEENHIEVHYRMAYVGTVGLTNESGELLSSRKYAVPSHEGPAAMLKSMMRDLRRALKHQPTLHVGVVQDGAPELWTLMREALTAAHVEKWHEAIDMFHLMQRLASALEIVEDDAQKRASQLLRWKKQLLRYDGAIASIARFFELRLGWLPWSKRREKAALLAEGFTLERHQLLGFADPSTPWPPPPPPLRWSAKQAAQLEKLLWSYLAYPGHFRYVRMRRLGLHVGSGVTEGACKSLVAARAKGSGQRWRQPGISAVLTLRSLLQSDRFDPFWDHLARRFAPLAA